ncbi:MAG: adenylyl-sulfate kinase [Vicinamibacterales bacterium]
MDLLRFLTAGSVDDGKSTLVGRLLFDSKAILDDQLAQIERAAQRLDGPTDLSLVTDGLRAEREQKITIDVAYRYFATPRRRFIIADTPGHVQYTRNMVTGASTADLAVILVDVAKGVLPQSRRHAFIASLLGIPQVIVAVNKMDLAGYSQARYEAVVAEFMAVAAKLAIPSISFLPVSALAGDNVVTPSAAMPWYTGKPLLELLESAPAARRHATGDFRFPVQYVIRPDQHFRGYAGTIASGVVQAGDEVVVLPSGRMTRINSIELYDGTRAQASSGEAVVLTTSDELDMSRGDLIVHPRHLPRSVTLFDADLCWMHETPLARERAYLMLHTTQQLQAHVTVVHHRIDMDTLDAGPADSLALNDIGHVSISTARAIHCDAYSVSAVMGGFVLVDPQSNLTVAAGMIRAPKTLYGVTTAPSSENVRWSGWNIPRDERERRNGHRAAVIWLTGLPGAGKTTIARGLERRLFDSGCQTMLLDGDQLRHGLCGDLGFSPAERAENIRRAGEAARLFFEQGSLVLCAFVSPYRSDRNQIRSQLPEGAFVEVFISAPLETCMQRDPKGLYARARRGEVPQLTGVGAPYEAPTAAEVVLDTERSPIDDSVEELLQALTARALLPRSESGRGG